MTENKRMNIKISALIAASVTILLLVILTRANFYTSVAPSGSMEPTIMTNSFSVLAKRVNTIKRYDIIVFDLKNKKCLQNGEKCFGKRVIGLPGELIEVKEDGVYADGKKLDDSYVSENNKKIEFGLGKYYVPEGCYFVLGDNRNNSADSRTNKDFAFVKRDWITATIAFNFNIITSAKDLRHPIEAIDFKDIRYKN